MENFESTSSKDALPSFKLENLPASETSCELRSSSEQSSEQNESETALAELPTTQQYEDEMPLPALPPPPPDNWHFNLFLNEIAEDLSNEEVEKLKFFFSGNDIGGIGKRHLDKITTPLQLFTILKSRQYLSRDNLIYLQMFLRHLDRKDLLKRAIEYANTVKNVIHFYPASEQPENGFRYIKFHVAGRNFRNCDRQYVQDLRNRVAAILFVPSEFVLIAGIEPSSSLLVTFMVPDMYVDLLIDFLKEGKQQLYLQDLSIDVVEIDGKQFNLGEVSEAEPVETFQQQKLANVYQQLELAVRQLEDSEIERLRLEDEIKAAFAKAEKTEFEMGATLTTLKKMFTSISNSPESPESVPSSLASQSALQEFERALRHPDISACEKKHILALISANTEVVVNRVRDEQLLQQRRLRLMVQDLQSQIQPLQLELTKYRFFSEVDIDKWLLERFQKLFNRIEVKVEIKIMEPYLKILKTISRKLNAREKTKLFKKYEWSPDEELKQTIENDQSFSWREFTTKRYNKNNSKLTLEVRRKDLLETFRNLVAKASGAQNPAPKKGKRKPAPKKAEVEKAEKVDLQDTEDETLSQMADQVQEIHDFLMNPRASQFLPKYDCRPPPYSMYDRSPNYKL